MPASDPWTIVVLAAGRGRRMGCAKALMMVGGRPWWRVQEERLSLTGLARLWVVSRDVAEQMAGCGSRLVIGDAEAPMFSSVRAGIEALPARSGALVLPVDVPAPAAPVFAALQEAAGPGVAVPVHDGQRGHPAALSWRWIESTFRPACARGGALRLDRLIESHAREVPVGDRAVVTNLNTPAELERWLAPA